jgi:hypothetical protein
MQLLQIIKQNPDQHPVNHWACRSSEQQTLILASLVGNA